VKVGQDFAFLALLAILNSEAEHADMCTIRDGTDHSCKFWINKNKPTVKFLDGTAAAMLSKTGV
jgi:hypothetical protein